MGADALTLKDGEIQNYPGYQIEGQVKSAVLFMIAERPQIYSSLWFQNTERCYAELLTLQNSLPMHRLPFHKNNFLSIYEIKPIKRIGISIVTISRLLEK